MKVQITFKTPDAAELAAEDTAHHVFNEDTELHQENYELLKDDILTKLGKWIRSGEYVTVEFDLENGNARVVERA